MSLGVRLSRCRAVCVSAEPQLHVRRISLGGEGNALYPVLCSLQHVFKILNAQPCTRVNGCVDDVLFSAVPSRSVQQAHCTVETSQNIALTR